MAVRKLKPGQPPKSVDKVKGSRIESRKAKTKKDISKVVPKNKCINIPKHENGLLKIVLDHRRQEIAKQNSENSPLLGLPFEVRNKIYSFVLGGKDYYVHTNKSKPICAIEEKPRATDRQLLRVCTQIYSEAAVLPFELNTFRCWPHVMGRWLRSLLPGHKNAIATLQVNYPETEKIIYDLKHFHGLKRILVCWTPYSRGHFSSLVQKLRKYAENPGLTVVFKHED